MLALIVGYEGNIALAPPWLSIAYPTHARAITVRDIYPMIAYKLALMLLWALLSSLDEFNLEVVPGATYNWF